MIYKDPEKERISAVVRKRRYRAKLHIKKYGEGVGNMQGRHGNHATGIVNGKWNEGQLQSSHGYVYVRVHPDHPHAFGHGYCYEHIAKMVGYLGRALTIDEVVHHRDGDKTNNEIENLELLTRSEHAKLHKETNGPPGHKGRSTRQS